MMNWEEDMHSTQEARRDSIQQGVAGVEVAFDAHSLAAYGAVALWHSTIR